MKRGTAAPEAVTRITSNIIKVIRGKANAVESAVIGLLAGGHVLVEDVPGVGKTTLARALAKSIDGSFRRIQFTPDLLPSDVVGVSIYKEQCGGFEFQQGPIFANIVLADEINRATPRTQSSLLEAMNDCQVTVDGKAHHLDLPFMVIATQNPVEIAGTYLLPESQLDRFLLKIRLGYPDREQEIGVLTDQKLRHPLDAIGPVVDAAEIRTLQAAVREIKVSAPVAEYIVAISDATRKSGSLRMGASPRASLALYRAAQARALARGRDFVIPDDVKKLAVSVLAHRVMEIEAGRGAAFGADSTVRDIVENVPVPV